MGDIVTVSSKQYRLPDVTVTGNLTLGTEESKINIVSENDSLRYTLSYQFGDISDTGIKNGKGYTGVLQSKITKGTGIKVTLPLKLANVIPNATTGSGGIKCDAYDGNTYVGTVYAPFICVVPSSIKPTITKPTLTIDNSSNATIKGWGLYVAGYSKVKITATTSGSYKSTVKTIKISGGISKTVNSTSLNYTTALTSGTKTFTVVATDSRNRNSDTKTSDSITVYAYSKPTIPTFKVSRGSTDKTKINVTANWSYSSVNGKNSLTTTLYYKKKNESSWQAYSGSLTKNTSTELSGTFSDTSSFDFRLVAKDSIGNSVQKDVSISTVDVLLDFKAGGKGFGVGKVAETDSIEVKLPSNFFSTIKYGTNAKFTLPSIQKGSVLITPSAANTPTKAEVTFPIAFAGIPNVTVTPATTVPGTQVTGVSIADLSATGVSIYLTRTNTTAVRVYWIAMY